MQPQTPPPAPKPNAVTEWISKNRSIPTWGLIVAILLACGFGFLVRPGGATSTVTTTASVAATHAPQSTATAVPSGPVASFSGDSNKNTRDFTITADQWTIAWTCTGNQFALFNIDVYNQDGSVNALGVVNPACTSAQSGSTIQHGAGTFYLAIASDSISWTVTVTQ